MSGIDGNNIFVTLGVVLGLTLWGLYTEQNRWLSKIPSVVWILTTGLLFSNLGLIPMHSPVYDFIGARLMPLAIPLLLYKGSLRSIVREGGMVLPIFIVGSITVCIGALVGYFVLDMGPIGPKVAATYAAGWIGGMTDFAALAQITGMTPSEFSVALSASAPVSILGLLALLAIPSIPFVRRHIHSHARHFDAAAEAEASVAEAKPTSFKPLHLITALTLSALICGVSDGLAKRFGLENYSLFIVSVLAVLAANLAPKQLSRLQGDFDLGMLIMYLFFATISAGTDATTFVHAAPKLFVFGMMIIAIHLLLLLLIASYMKFDLAEMIIGSGANIVGSAAAAGVASSKGWTRLVTPAITIGMLGKAVATFFGIALFRLLS